MNSVPGQKHRRSFIHDAMVLVGNQFTVMSIGMITGVVLARCLGASGRGLVAAVMVYPAILLSLMDMGVRQASAYYIGKGLYSNTQVVGAITAIVLTVGLVGAGACAASLQWMGNPLVTPLITLLAVAPIPFSIFTSYISGVFLGNRMVGQFANIGWLVALLNLLAAVLLVWLLGWGAGGALAATVLSKVAVVGYAIWLLSALAPIRPRFEWPVMRALLTKGMVYSVALFVITLNYKVNLVVMGKLSNVDEIGIFALGVSVAQLTWALPQAITTALFSHSATAPDEDVFSGKVMRLFRVTLLVALILVVGLGLTVPFLIPLVYGEEFRPSVRVIFWLLPGVFCLLGLKVLNMDLAGRGKPNASLWAMVPALAVNGGLSLWLVPRYGAQGAAIASSAAYVLGGIGMTIVYCRYVGIGFPTLWRYRRSDFYFIEQRFRRGLRASNGIP